MFRFESVILPSKVSFSIQACEREIVISSEASTMKEIWLFSEGFSP